MAEQLFDVRFAGELVAGASAEQVQANLAKLFKTEPTKLAHLFAGNSVTIKKGLDLAEADKYEAVLRRAGAIVDVVEHGKPSANQNPPTEQTNAAPTPTPAPAQGAAPATSSTPSTGSSPLDGDPDNPPQAPSDMTMAEVGVTIVEPPNIPPADFDTTHLNLAEVGVDLVEAERVAAPEYDLSGFTLDPAGVDLVEKKPTEPANIDTSGLSLSEPN